MHCLFCKADSRRSKSVEHIIPESLGNKESVLPPGVVCDSCNNYFAREVEKPFLEHSSVINLRFHQLIASKRGSIPAEVAFSGGYVVKVHRDSRGRITEVEYPEEAEEGLRNGTITGLFLLEESQLPLPTGPTASRLLAKVGLETIARNTLPKEGTAESLINEIELDPIRRHAREGRIPKWPVSARRIYDPNHLRKDESGNSVQVLHEYGILRTGEDESFFVLVLFGVEFAINMKKPDLSGYSQWLQHHGESSPFLLGSAGFSKIGETVRVGDCSWKMKNHSPARSSPEVFLSTPHPDANPYKASLLNIQYQDAVAAWKALPLLKRLFRQKPKPPTGI